MGLGGKLIFLIQCNHYYAALIMSESFCVINTHTKKMETFKNYVKGDLIVDYSQSSSLIFNGK